MVVLAPGAPCYTYPLLPIIAHKTARSPLFSVDLECSSNHRICILGTNPPASVEPIDHMTLPLL